MSHCNDTKVPAILMWGGGVSEGEDQVVRLGPQAECVELESPQF